MNKLIKLGVSGEAASFSEQAGLLYAKNQGIEPVLEYLLDMEGVLAAVENGSVDLGIFPVVNLRGGLVRMAYDAMGKHKFEVMDELWLNVSQCLLVRPGISMKQIESIVSHTQALAQCKEYIKKHFNHVELITWEDTAKAARDLSQGKLNANAAVIAPMKAASIYGLEILAKDIQDANPNLTAFIIVQKQVKNMETIQQLRNAIDQTDADMLELLALRTQLAIKIGKIKAQSGISVLDNNREQALMRRYEELCEQFALQPDFVKQLFQMIITHCRSLQQ